MYPHERSLVKQLAGKPFALIGVNSDSNREIPKTLVADGTVTWRSFWDGTAGRAGPISRNWEIEGWPTIFLIDANGVIRHKDNTGRLRGRALDAAIEKLLEEMGQPVQIHGER